MTQTYTPDGKLIISEHESYITNEQGISVRRRETILQDGSSLVHDTPVSNMTGGSPGIVFASAPMEDEIDVNVATAYPEIPFAHATSVAINANHILPVGTMDLQESSCEPIAVATGSPQPPQVAIVTGPPRPPQFTPMPSRYRNSNGACTCCGITTLTFALICACCILPLIIFFVIWAISLNSIDSFFVDDDDFMNTNQDDNEDWRDWN